jgi:hypothetical protein
MRQLEEEVRRLREDRATLERGQGQLLVQLQEAKAVAEALQTLKVPISFHLVIETVTTALLRYFTALFIYVCCEVFRNDCVF